MGILLQVQLLIFLHCATKYSSHISTSQKRKRSKKKKSAAAGTKEPPYGRQGGKGEPKSGG